MNEQNQSSSSIPTAPTALRGLPPVETPAPLKITDHALLDGVTEIVVGEDHTVLDVHMVDGCYRLRVLEDTISATTTIRVVPATLGTRLKGSIDDYEPIPTRAGGAHFFLV